MRKQCGKARTPAGLHDGPLRWPVVYVFFHLAPSGRIAAAGATIGQSTLPPKGWGQGLECIHRLQFPPTLFREIEDSLPGVNGRGNGSRASESSK